MYKGPERKLNRWQGYDYKYPGLYFITICTRDRQLKLWIISYKIYDQKNQTDF